MRYDSKIIYDEQFNYIIDNEKYQFKVTLFNPEGDNIVLNKSAVLELKLRDNIFMPWVKGTIILDNTDDALERFKSNPTDLEFFQSNSLVTGYSFRGDGRDFLKIEIIPIDSRSEDYEENSEAYNAAFGLRYIFTLDNEKHLSVKDTPAKEFQIVDYDLEIFRERKSFFSSSDILTLDVADISQLSNKEREIETGKCLKHLIQTSLNDPKSIFTKEGTEEDITPFFESGLSKIFYSAPGVGTSYNDLMYILKRHVSSSNANDFSFLKKLNGTGEYTLESASKIFSLAYDKSRDYGGSRFAEELNITGQSREEENIIEKNSKSPSHSLKFGEKSDIISYSFFNTSSKMYKEKIKSRIVNSYDFKNKKFNIKSSENNIISAREKFSTNFVNVLKGKDDAPYPNLPLTIMQTDNFSYENEFSEYGDNINIEKAYGVNKIMQNALVTNIGAEILIKGQLSRKSGSFISIERSGDYIDNKFDNKFLGIYFILEVQHEFINDTEYYNKLILVKTYHFSNPKIKENLI